jgi:RNA polymerase sigma factor FliA
MAMETGVKEVELRELWRRYKDQGDAAARERLVVAYSPMVKFVAGRLGAGLPSHVEDADLISYGLVGLIGAIERFEPERGIKFETFAMTRIRGSIYALDELWTVSDSSGDQVSLLDTIADEGAADPQEALASNEVKDRLTEAIGSLPEREQLVVALYYYENLTLREIGEVLGVTESRVSQLHTKAVMRLKSHLQQG